MPNLSEPVHERIFVQEKNRQDLFRSVGDRVSRPRESSHTLPELHRVLYIDDEPALLDICKQYFKARAGDISITGVQSAGIALEMLETSSFDVIISDYQMPEMDGIELLKHLQAINNTTPFILFTGRGREEVVIEAINNGATYYLQKGGKPKAMFTELEHKIREAIRRQSAEKALQESENRYRTVFEISGAAIIIIEEDMTISLCNQEFLRLVDLERSDVEGLRRLPDFIHDDDLPDILHRYDTWDAPGDTGTIHYDARIVTKNGIILSVSIKSDYIPGTKMSVLSITDFSEQKRLIEELRRKDDEILLLHAALAKHS